ncbi:ABC transporter ATP-binding protein [Tannockella kyphosi]|uniref:ABC transporter ATP-binding protein n=1 Tax=Tannockella kyphosi TaxID=2899121 RepID=UPI00201176DF|nr:ABC transporter ATP-binding protein [Tannockella kyphosi]
MRIFFKHVKPYLGFFLLAPIFMLIEVYCDVKIPSLSANIINLAIAGTTNREILMSVAEMFLYAIIALGGGIGSSFCATRASVHFCHDLRAELFERIQAFSFYNIDKFSTGSLVTRLTNDVTQVGQIIVMSLRMLFRAPGMLIGAIIMAYRISPSMSILFFILTPVLAMIVFCVLQVSYPRFAKLQDRIDAINTTVQEGLINVRVIKAFTREGFEKEKFKEVNENLRDTGLSAYRVNIIQMPLMTFTVNMTTIAILWFGSSLLGTGELLIGDISAFITYLTQILMSVNMIANVFLQSARSAVSANRIREVLEDDIDIHDQDALYPNKVIESGSIRFENVYFRYFENAKENVLTNINLEILSGQSIGIVGSTGCGKTSLVHLISRLYDVSSGAVYVDDTNVKDYSLTNLRQGVAVVLQNNLLFSGTVKENLLWGNPNASLEEMVEASEFAAAKEFVEKMSDQFDTFINQGGHNLSGGQKQRLCIARALMKKTKILLLDDSSSAVDMATERKIIHHLTYDLKDMTKIIIAQRLSSVINCDLIVVMEQGSISAIGSHLQLLEQSKVYQEIYYSQNDNGACDSVTYE